MLELTVTRGIKATVVSLLIMNHPSNVQVCGASIGSHYKESISIFLYINSTSRMISDFEDLLG